MEKEIFNFFYLRVLTAIKINKPIQESDAIIREMLVNPNLYKKEMAVIPLIINATIKKPIKNLSIIWLTIELLISFFI